MRVSKFTHRRMNGSMELNHWRGVEYGVGALSVVPGWACGACLESAAGRNRMSRRVSVEPAPLISGSRCSLLGCRAVAFWLALSGCQL